MNFKVKVTSIDYCIEEEDICWQFDNQADLEEDSDEYYEAIDNEIKRLRKTLPQELELDFYDCENEDLPDLIADAISEETGWLVNSFTWKLAN